jgi:hypothetical protein
MDVELLVHYARMSLLDLSLERFAVLIVGVFICGFALGVALKSCRQTQREGG